MQDHFCLCSVHKPVHADTESRHFPVDRNQDEPPQQKHDGLNSLMQLAAGTHYQVNSTGMPSTIQTPQERVVAPIGGAPVGGGPSVMYQRNGGTHNAPATQSPVTVQGRVPQQVPTSQPAQMQTLVQQPSVHQGMPPGMVQPSLQVAPQQAQAPAQAYQQPAPTMTQYSLSQQQPSQETRQHVMPTAAESIGGSAPQAGSGMQTVAFSGQQAPAASSQVSAAPANVQYIQLADGTIRAMVPVQGDMPRASHLGNVSQDPQKSPIQAPVQPTAAVYPSTLNSVPSETSNQYASNVREQSAEYQQMVAPLDMRTTALPDPVPALDPVVGARDVPLEGAVPSDQAPVLPVDATETLYVEDVPTDMSKRELSHIFRPFGGFKEVRIVNKTKEEKSFSFAFAEFETAECAAAALGCLHGYQFDPDNIELGVMHLRYARGGSQKSNNRGMNQVHQDGKQIRQGTGQAQPARRGPAVMQQQPNQAAPQRGGGQIQRPHGAGNGAHRGMGGRNNQGGRGPARNTAGWRGMR